MKKKTLIISVAACVLLGAVVAFVLLSANSPGYFRATYESGGETLEFYKDGTMELYGKDMVFEGTYERTEKNTYEVRINALIVQLRFMAVKDGDTIIFTDKSDDSTNTYTLKK